MALARIYFDIRVWSSLAVLWNFVIIGWLLGMQNARGPLAMMLAINLTNAALDIVFVRGLGMNVDGVALATAIAELVGLITGSLFVWSELRSRNASWNRGHYFQLSRYAQLFAINGNLFLRSMALMFTLGIYYGPGGPDGRRDTGR